MKVQRQEVTEFQLDPVVDIEYENGESSGTKELITNPSPMEQEKKQVEKEPEARLWSELFAGNREGANGLRRKWKVLVR